MRKRKEVPVIAVDPDEIARRYCQYIYEWYLERGRDVYDILMRKDDDKENDNN